MPDSEPNPTPRPAPFQPARVPDPPVPHEIKADWTRYQMPGFIIAAVVLAGAAFLFVQDTLRRRPEIERQLQAANRELNPQAAAAAKVRLDLMPSWLQAYPNSQWPQTFRREHENLIVRTYTFITVDPPENVIAYYRDIFRARGVEPVEGDARSAAVTNAVAGTPGASPSIPGARVFSATDEARRHSVDLVISPAPSQGNLVILNYLTEIGAPEL